MAAATLVERGVDVLMLDAGLRAPSGFVVRAAGNTVARRYGWSEYSTDRLDPSSARDVDWYLQPVARRAVQLLDGRRPPVRSGGLHRRRPPRRALRVADHATTTSCRSTSGPSAPSPSPPASAIPGVPADVRSLPAPPARRTGRSSPTRRPRRATASARCRWPRGRRGWSPAGARSSAATTAWSRRCWRRRGSRSRTGAHALRLDIDGRSGHGGDLRRPADRAASSQSRCRRRRRRRRRHRLDGAAAALDVEPTSRPASATRSVSSAATSTTTPGSGGRRRPTGRSARSPTRCTSPAAARRHGRALTGSSITLGLAPTKERLRTYYRGRVTLVRGAGVRHDGADPRRRRRAAARTRQPTTPSVRPLISLRYDQAATRHRWQPRPTACARSSPAPGSALEVPGPFHELRPGSSVHYGGSVRMHDEPEFGVLDGWNRMHEVPNVVVADSSCFTTGPEKNPTLTAMAIADPRRRSPGRPTSGAAEAGARSSCARSSPDAASWQSTTVTQR